MRKLLFIYENDALRGSPFWQPPFIPLSNVTYLSHAVPWMLFPHFHEREHEISWIVSGRGSLNLPGHILPLEPGTITFVPAQVAHCYLEEEGSALEYYTVRFWADGPETPLLARLTELGCCTVNRPELVELCHHTLRTLLPRLAREQSRVDPTLQTAGLMLFQLAAEAMAEGGRPIALFWPAYANDILTYLQTHVGERITMEDVAREFHLSQAHIFRVFRQTYHISPINYLIYCRMREARALLLKYHISREELARRLAYTNVYHFSKTFQHFFGCEPEKYLEKVRASEI